MHLLDQRLLGFVLLLLLGMLVLVKRLATGSLVERPTGSLLVRLVNSFNLFFLLVVNPLVAILLIAERLPESDPTHLAIDAEWLVRVVEVVGLALSVAGYLLMAWALNTLGRNYQLGGSAPRSDDRLVVAGPYKWIRHPMYTAALSICFGLALLIQSAALIAVFLIYLALITPLIPIEEDVLRKAYGEPYSVYQHTTTRLIPFVY